MKKILLSAVAVVAVFSGSLCTFAEQKSALDGDLVTAKVNYLKVDDHKSAVVHYIDGGAATANIRYINTDRPQAVVHFNEEKTIKARKLKNRNKDEVVSNAAVDIVESGAAVK
jgi:uncharacterized protein YxeA